MFQHILTTFRLVPVGSSFGLHPAPHTLGPLSGPVTLSGMSSSTLRLNHVAAVVTRPDIDDPVTHSLFHPGGLPIADTSSPRSPILQPARTPSQSIRAVSPATMKTVATFLLVLAFALAAVQGRQLKQSAEAAVAGNSQLSTFQAALKVGHQLYCDLVDCTGADPLALL